MWGFFICNKIYICLRNVCLKPNVETSRVNTFIIWSRNLGWRNIFKFLYLSCLLNFDLCKFNSWQTVSLSTLTLELSNIIKSGRTDVSKIRSIEEKPGEAISTQISYPVIICAFIHPASRTKILLWRVLYLSSWLGNPQFDKICLLVWGFSLHKRQVEFVALPDFTRYADVGSSCCNASYVQIGPCLRARWMGGVEAHLFCIGHFALTSLVFEI